MFCKMGVYKVYLFSLNSQIHPLFLVFLGIIHLMECLQVLC